MGRGAAGAEGLVFGEGVSSSPIGVRLGEGPVLPSQKIF